MTLLDLLILLVVIAAAVAGFRRLGGSGRAGRLLGLLVGAGVCAGIGSTLAGLGGDPASRGVLFWAGVLGGLVLGGAIGGWLGGLLTRVLVGGRLAVVDRALGALAGAAGALLVLWLLATVVPVLLGPGPLEPVTAVLAPLGGRSAVLGAVGHALPSTSHDVGGLLAPVAAP